MSPAGLPPEPSLASLQRQVDVLLRVDSFMSTLTDLDQLLKQIMNESQFVTDAEASSLALYNEKNREFVFEVALGEKGPETKQLRIKYGEGIIGHVALTGRSQNIPDAYGDKNFSSRADRKTGFKTRSILAVPMFRRDRLIGVIEVLNKKGGRAFTGEDQQILEILAHQAAIAIENARLFKENLAREHLASLGQGISGAAHCIKNILNIITVGAGGIEFGLERNNTDLIKTSWSPLRKACERISDLVMDLLSYAKERVPELTPVALHDMLKDIMEMIGPRCREAGVEIKESFDPAVGTMLLDRNGIHRCIMNLISNALEALDKKGSAIEITSTLDSASQEVELCISDNGPGIPPESLDKIFEVFYSTKGSHGTGLGLAITRKIIAEHGGTIFVASDPGEGATFFIRLPVQRATAPAGKD